MSAAEITIDYSRLWQYVSGQCHALAHSVHGPDHWKRVERNALLLATRTGANIAVVRLFAVFHDCRRENDFFDEGHGARGAEYASSLRNTLFHLPDDAFELLLFACKWHTDGHHHENPTVGTCWDADRLDLGRISIIPDPKFMSTDFGREIAECGSIQPFLNATNI
jgi:uncharacterized protein